MTALDKAFYDSFKVTKSSGKRFYLGLDVSGSMGSQISCAPMSCLQASVAMALVTMNVEDFCDVRMFSDGTNHNFGFGRSSAVRAASKDLLAKAPITVGMTLPQAVERMSGMSFGSTDCALPMVDALARKVKVDCFVTYTDNETWAGSIHPSKALEKYRQGMGIDAKLATVGMTSTGFSICDPNDAGSVDVVGFDANTPSFISNFAAGEGIGEGCSPR
jgi:60 kDa SS-A/Ro ribonucleoprotein